MTPNDPFSEFAGEIRTPARYGCHAFFADGRAEAFWSDDRAEVLARYESQVADPDADFVMAFDFREVRELSLFIAEFDRPRRDAEGRPIQRSYAEIKCASDEAIDRAIDRMAGAEF